MKKKYLINLLYTIATIFGFFINSYNIVYNITNVSGIFKSRSIVVFVVSLLIYYFYLKINNHKINISKKILSLFFAIMIVLGNSFIELNSWELVFGNYKFFIMAVISIVGYYVLFTKGFVLLDNFIKNAKLKDVSIKKNTKFYKLICFFDEKPFLSSLIILAIFWAFYFIAYYPVVLSPDPNYQILQYFGVPTKYLQYAADKTITITNHHPVFHTFLLGGCISLGRALINDNFGLFIYSFLQAITLAITLSYSIFILKKNGINKKFRLILIFIYAFVPMYGFYAVSAVKDTFYSCFVILYILFIYDFIKNKSLNIKQLIALFIVTLLISLFRNNGFYLVLLSCPFIIFYNKKHVFNLSVVFILLIASYVSFNKILLPVLGIENTGIEEALSIPLQQTARYVKEHSDELTKEDKKVIDNLLDYDTLASRYNPTLSDNVKKYFNGNASRRELEEYFEVWKKGLSKHPETYIEATLNNTYGFLTPNSVKWYIHSGYAPKPNGNGQVIMRDKTLVGDHWPSIDSVVDYHFNDLGWFRNIMQAYGEAFPYIPIIGFISNIGANSWMLLILAVYLFTTKNKKYIITLIPLFITLLMCLIGPANTYFRYAMPYIFIMPFLVILFLHEIKKNVL